MKDKKRKIGDSIWYSDLTRIAEFEIILIKSFNIPIPYEEYHLIMKRENKSIFCYSEIEIVIAEVKEENKTSFKFVKAFTFNNQLYSDKDLTHLDVNKTLIKGEYYDNRDDAIKDLICPKVLEKAKENVTYPLNLKSSLYKKGKMVDQTSKNINLLRFFKKFYK